MAIAKGIMMLDKCGRTNRAVSQLVERPQCNKYT